MSFLSFQSFLQGKLNCSERLSWELDAIMLLNLESLFLKEEMKACIKLKIIFNLTEKSEGWKASNIKCLSGDLNYLFFTLRTPVLLISTPGKPCQDEHPLAALFAEIQLIFSPYKTRSWRPADNLFLWFGRTAKSTPKTRLVERSLQKVFQGTESNDIRNSQLLSLWFCVRKKSVA